MPRTYDSAVEEEAEKDGPDQHPKGESEPDIDVKTLEELSEDVESTVRSVPDFLKPSGGARDDVDLGGRRGSFDIDIAGLENLNQASLMEVLARVSIAQLSALFDIADAVEPFTNITVSGINSISQSDIAEPVVPASDDDNIPTRRLMLRASRKNTDKIYFGDDQVAPNSGFVLEAGEMINLQTDLRGEELYMVSETEGEEVQLLGMI